LPPVVKSMIMFSHHHNHQCLSVLKCFSMWDLIVNCKLLSDEIYELLVAVVQVVKCSLMHNAN